MFVRITFFLIGFGLTIIGFIYIVSYLNLMTIGYNFIEYVKFIIGRLECIIAIIGLIILTLSIYMPSFIRRKKDELYI